MIKNGFIKEGICYIDGSRGAVVKHPFADRTLKDVCVSCYKSLNPVEEKEPKVKRGRKYWIQTEIEKEFTTYFDQNVDRWLHELIVSLKGPTKYCLLRRDSDDI